MSQCLYWLFSLKRYKLLLNFSRFLHRLSGSSLLINKITVRSSCQTSWASIPSFNVENGVWFSRKLWRWPDILRVCRVSEGFYADSSPNYNCRGWGVQWNENSGRCGICGDPWDDFPREHEAPLGKRNMSTISLSQFFLKENLPREQLSGIMSQGPGYLSLLISPQIMVDTSYSSFARTMTLHKTQTNGALISIFWR